MCWRKPSEADGGSGLVMERLAQRFAESAQQMVGTQSAGIEKSLGATVLVVRAKETGEPPTIEWEKVA